MTVQTTVVRDSVIGLTWNVIPGAAGYNVYRENTKLNAEPVTNNYYPVTGLTQNTYHTFYVAAVTDGRESGKSDALRVATKRGAVANGMLPSGVDKQLNMPFSDMALNMEYKGICLTDPNYYYWCISPIEAEDGRIHLYTCRWPVPNNYEWSRYMGPDWWNGDMGGWKNICEIAHFVGDHPEGPFTYVDTPISNDVLRDNGITGQVAPHNIRVKRIDGLYCLLYITQKGNWVWHAESGKYVTNLNGANAGQDQQRECLATAPTPNGPWTFGGDKGDGIVVEPAPAGSGHWTAGSCLGTDNGDIIKIDGKYRVYFKAGPGMDGSMHYGYAESTELTKGYVKSNVPSTDNIHYIEDANVFEWNGKIYLLTTDNFGTNSNIFEAGILWESQDRGNTFKLADAKIGFGLLHDYMAVPPMGNGPGFSHAAYGAAQKFERPAVLMQGGKPTYFYAAVPLNLSGYNATNSVVMKINDAPYDPKFPVTGKITFNGNGSTGGSMSAVDVAIGSSCKLPDNKFTRTGYTFAGWQASGGVGGTYKDGEKLKYILDDVTLTAIWQ
ncbi:MAG: InlB B-repeat-containing protein [Oscillospiraceae bacterium]|nr:InlB B-repeat-containing protein [Oscillospiraceae bacterium]